MLPAALRSATWLAPLKEIDCGFRNLASSWACYLVFKDRVACAACDFLLPSSVLLPRHSFVRRGVSFYLSRRLLSTAVFAFSLASGVFSAAQWLPLFSSRGARLLPLCRPPCQPCFVDSLDSVARLPLGLPCRGRGFYHHRVSCQLAALTAIFRFFNCLARSAFRASARASLRGRGFYHRRASCQPPGASCSELPTDPPQLHLPLRWLPLPYHPSAGSLRLRSTIYGALRRLSTRGREPFRLPRSQRAPP